VYTVDILECGKIQDYSFQTNGYWLAVVTMTTVGFGDFYPMTYFGRITIIFASFVGTFVISMTMVSLNRTKDFSLQENKSFTLIRRLSVRKKIQHFAGKSILYFLRSVRSMQKLEADPNNPVHRTDLTLYEESYERYIEQFKALRTKLIPDEVP